MKLQTLADSIIHEYGKGENPKIRKKYQPIISVFARMGIIKFTSYKRNGRTKGYYIIKKLY